MIAQVLTRRQMTGSQSKWKLTMCDHRKRTELTKGNLQPTFQPYHPGAMTTASLPDKTGVGRTNINAGEWRCCMEEVLTVQRSPWASPTSETPLPLCVRWQDPKMHRNSLAEHSQFVHNLHHRWPCRVVVVVSQLRCLTDLTGNKNLPLTPKAPFTSCWVTLAPPAKCQLLKAHFLPLRHFLLPLLRQMFLTVFAGFWFLAWCFLLMAV